MKYCGTTWKENKTPTFSSLSRSNLSETEPDESVTVSAVRIVFFYFKSNIIVELLFEISNPIEQSSSVSKVTSSKYLLNKFNCFYGTALLWFLL